jgi:hypothetical protein
VIATARKNCDELQQRLLSSEGMPKDAEERLRIPSQFLRAVAITGSSVRVRSCCAKANPNPREAGVTKATRTELPVIATARKNCDELQQRLLSSEGMPKDAEGLVMSERMYFQELSCFFYQLHQLGGYAVAPLHLWARHYKAK